MFLPKRHACLDALRLDETSAVRSPVFGRRGAGRQDHLLHLWQKMRTGQLLLNPCLGQAVLLRNLGSQGFDRRAVAKDLAQHHFGWFGFLVFGSVGHGHGAQEAHRTEQEEWGAETAPNQGLH